MAGPKYQCSGLPLGSTMWPTGRPMPSSALRTSLVGATGELSCASEAPLTGHQAMGMMLPCTSAHVAGTGKAQGALARGHASKAHQLFSRRCRHLDCMSMTTAAGCAGTGRRTAHHDRAFRVCSAPTSREPSPSVVTVMRRSGSPTSGIGNGCVNVHRPSPTLSTRVARPLRGGSAEGNSWSGRRSLPLSSSAHVIRVVGRSRRTYLYRERMSCKRSGSEEDGVRVSKTSRTSRWSCFRVPSLDKLGADDACPTRGRDPAAAEQPRRRGIDASRVVAC